MGGVPGIKRKKKKSPVRARSDYTRAILMTVAAAGVLSMAVLAPNAIQILKPILENRHYDPTKYVRRKTASLVKAGLLEFQQEDGKKYLALTPQGERELERLRLRQEWRKPIRRWDGRWHVVMFDIKEFRRRDRDLLRDELRNFGFQKLQASVWVSPRDATDIIPLLKADLGIGKDILYMTVESIENDPALRKQFGLPLT